MGAVAEKHWKKTVLQVLAAMVFIASLLSYFIRIMNIFMFFELALYCQ